MILHKRKLKPETAAEVTDATTIDGMRRRINQHQREDPMVKALFDAAWHRGLSGEDTMTWLAYEALLAKERCEDMLLENVMSNPNPPLIDATATPRGS